MCAYLIFYSTGSLFGSFFSVLKSELLKSNETYIRAIARIFSPCMCRSIRVKQINKGNIANIPPGNFVVFLNTIYN